MRSRKRADQTAKTWTIGCALKLRTFQPRSGKPAHPLLRMTEQATRGRNKQISSNCSGTSWAAVSDRPAEDTLAMIRRHVLEAEGHIARQEALVAKLDRGGHVALLAEARELFDDFANVARTGAGTPIDGA
jgi:hypothetical protein